MKKKKIKKIPIILLKNSSLKLRSDYQIPLRLHLYISKLDVNSDIDWINYLKECSVHMLRIKGYYKTYTDVEREFNEVLKNEYERRFLK